MLGKWIYVCHFLWDSLCTGYHVLSHCGLYWLLLSSLSILCIHFTSVEPAGTIYIFLKPISLGFSLAIGKIPTTLLKTTSTTLSNFNLSKWQTSEFSKWVKWAAGERVKMGCHMISFSGTNLVVVISLCFASETPSLLHPPHPLSSLAKRPLPLRFQSTHNPLKVLTHTLSAFY